MKKTPPGNSGGDFFHQEKQEISSKNSLFPGSRNCCRIEETEYKAEFEVELENVESCRCMGEVWNCIEMELLK